MSTNSLRQRVPSLAESTCSFASESDEESTSTTHLTTTKSKQLERRRSSISEVANSTFLRKRLSRQSSLPWGHKRSTMIGISCFLFLLPIPCLFQSCCPFAAFMLAVVTVSSFSSDYLYSGVESWSHLFDRALAPIAFVSLQHIFFASWYFFSVYRHNQSLTTYYIHSFTYTFVSFQTFMQYIHSSESSGCCRP